MVSDRPIAGAGQFNGLGLGQELLPDFEKEAPPLETVRASHCFEQGCHFRSGVIGKVQSGCGPVEKPGQPREFAAAIPDSSGEVPLKVAVSSQQITQI